MIFRKLIFSLTILFTASGIRLDAEQSDAQYIQDQSWTDQCNLAPACCPSPCNNHFFVRGDVLYWTPRITGLELNFGTSEIAESFVDCTQILVTKENDRDPHFKWDAGYRAGLGYETDKWISEVLWTHFDGNGDRRSHHSFSHGKATIKFDQVDLALAYNYDISCGLTLRPFVGVRGTRIHEHLESILVTKLALVGNPDALETRRLNDQQKYLGVGPLFGLEGNWDIACGFGLYGTIAGSLLYGNYEVTFDDFDFFSSPISKQIYSFNKRHLHAFDYNLDLGVGINWHKTFGKRFELNMKLGFEQHQYFNLNRISVGRGDVSFTGLVFAIELGF